MHPAWNTDREVAPGYERHQSEHTPLYKIIDRHYSSFPGHLAQQGAPCRYRCREFEEYLTIGKRLSAGTLSELLR